jgi:hypothetical protein
MKARQSAKMREIADALSSVGVCGLDAQADLLGIGRSTAWTILRGSHKSTGISPAVISRMLKADALPASVRAKIVEYANEKAAGAYGHNRLQRRRFIEAFIQQTNRRFKIKSAAGIRKGYRSEALRMESDDFFKVIDPTY